ncbi:development-specific protein S-like isoform X1 [Porites lutea]|uniref:development-specific protein S-like isoform X1 n=1 Tax=Porites lutea TaxID=51062 RepID=UPI003CC651C3
MAKWTVKLFGQENCEGHGEELREDTTDKSDLTNIFPKGVTSIILEEKAPKWQAFTQVGYNGAHVILNPGRRYSSLVVMGLENPVMSLRTFDKSATLVLYENEDYGGRALELGKNSAESADLTENLPNGVHSIVLKENAEKMQVFTKISFHGAHVTLHPGRRYSSLDAMGLVNPVVSLRIFNKPGVVQVYEDEEYAGKVLELHENAPDLTNTFSRGARSIVLKENAQKWQVCSQVEYEGAHVILEPGRRYSSLCVMGLVNPVMSMRKSGKSQ